MQPFDQALVVLLAALNHPSQGVGKPFLELAVRLEDVGHQEVHEGPELHQAVLQRGAGQQQAALAASGAEWEPAQIDTQNGGKGGQINTHNQGGPN